MVKDCAGNTAFSAARTVEAGTSTCGNLVQGGAGSSCWCSQPAPVQPQACTTCNGGEAPVPPPPLPPTATYVQHTATAALHKMGCYGVTAQPKAGNWADQGRRRFRRFMAARGWVSEGQAIQSQQSLAVSSAPAWASGNPYSQTTTAAPNTNDGYFPCNSASAIGARLALLIWFSLLHAIALST